MTGQGRPSLAKKQTRASKAKQDDELNRGVAFTDHRDGCRPVAGKCSCPRLTVRIGDVRGSHDRMLRQATGLDFVGLLEALTISQGTDLLAALVWFARIVNDHNTGQTLDELLDEFGYAELERLDMDKPEKKGGAGPEA